MMTRRPVSHIYLVPTLLDLMGRKVPEVLQGESLLPALEGGRRREDHVFIEWHEPPSGPDARAVISPDGWKLGIFDTDDSMLFHQTEDPLEMHKLFYDKQYSEVVGRLRKKLT